MAVGSLQLDGVAARFEVGKDYTTAEAKKLTAESLQAILGPRHR